MDGIGYVGLIGRRNVGSRPGDLIFRFINDQIGLPCY
jgi:hypothetical protein